MTLWSSASKLATQNSAQIDSVRYCIVRFWLCDAKHMLTLYLVCCYPREQDSCCVARLKASRCVVRGHVLPSRSMLATLGIATHDSVYLRVLKLPALPPSSVTLLTNLEDLDDGDSALACQVQQSFLHWSNSTEQSHVIGSGSVLRLELESGEVVQAIADVRYNADESLTAEQQQGNALGRPYAIPLRMPRIIRLRTNCFPLLQVFLLAP